ncbi:hypothetical protein EMCRGX_G021841 [Ephydatia muelleri]
MNSSARSSCPFCPDITLDPISHHAISCRHGGDVVIRHNRLRNIIVNLCRHAHLSARVEVGRGLLGSHDYSRPADVLVDGWDRAKSAACDVTITSSLTPATLTEASIHEGAAALAAETRKHAANDARCQAAWMDMHSSCSGNIWELGKGSRCFGERKHGALGKGSTMLWGKEARCFGERKHGALGKGSTVLWGKEARCFGEGSTVLWGKEARCFGERKHGALGKISTVLWGKEARSFGERKHGALGKGSTVLWGKEARCFFSRLATLLALRQGHSKSTVVNNIYGWLNLSLVSLFDDEVRQCFAECTAVDTPDFTWQQAQLSLSRGGLGLRRVSYHSPATYVASAVSSGLSHEHGPSLGAFQISGRGRYPSYDQLDS